ncbi:MAG: hypothetical protein ACR2OM_10095 [Aestuariivirgaceae bacterium]
MEQLIIQLISGAVGGNAAGAVMKQHSIGAIGNTIAGVIGGGVGGQILNAVTGMGGAGGMDIGSIISQVAGGGVGGGILMVVVSLIKGAMNKG